MKRSRSPSPPRQAPATASRAIQSTIALLSSHHLPSAVFRSLLDSLSDAHGAAVTQEDAHEKREGKRVKVERVHVAVQTDPVEEEQPAVEEEKEEDDPPVPPMPRWSLQAVQGELSELERMVMRDVEAALPLLDKLNADGHIDLLEWETALPMPPDSNWARSLPKPRVLFSSQYPQAPPKVKLPAGFFHPNVYPSGTVCSTGRALERLGAVWGEDFPRVLELLAVQPPESNLKNGYANLPPPLRLPMLLVLLQQTTAFEDTDDPAQLEAYTVAKKQPEEYKKQVQQVISTILPSPQDIEDLIEARRRHEWRVATGQAPSMTGE